MIVQKEVIFDDTNISVTGTAQCEVTNSLFTFAYIDNIISREEFVANQINEKQVISMLFFSKDWFDDIINPTERMKMIHNMLTL